MISSNEMQKGLTLEIEGEPYKGGEKDQAILWGRLTLLTQKLDGYPQVIPC